jgi:hypothetical protein
MTKFENKVWLSSPTMHGDEMKYAVALSAGTAFKMTPEPQVAIIQTIRNCFA